MRSILNHRFSIETSDSSVNSGVEQATARIAAPSASVRSPAESAWVALAALAMGDHGAGREAVRRLGDPTRAAGSIAEQSTIVASRSEPMGYPLAPYLLLAARCFAWTGDHAFLLDEWPRIDRALAAAGLAEAHMSNAAIRAVALRELAVVAGDIGRPADVARLTRAATREPAASDSEIEPAIAMVLGGSASPDAIAEALRAYALSSASGGHERAGPTEAAKLIAALVHGVLGTEPDAARQRLALRPRLPESWTSLRIANLCVGDAVVALRHTTDAARRMFTFEQVAGAAPLRLAFEPALPASALRAAEVDGSAARLDVRRVHGRIIAPVQLVLDHERTVSFAY